MDTLKTAVVVVVLLAVLYGVYRVLNMPDQQMLSQDMFLAPQVEMSTAPSEEFVAVNDQTNSFSQSAGSRLTSEPIDGSAHLEMPPPLASGSAQLSGSSNSPFSARAPNVPSSEPLAPTPPPTSSQPVNISAGQTDFASTQSSSVSTQTSSNPPPPPPTRQTEDFAIRGLESAWQKARQQVDESRFREALAGLSTYYDLPGLTNDQHDELLTWLDPLAGKVVYSMEHRIEDPHIVRRGDTLEQIAGQYGVPAQLLLNINRNEIRDPQALVPGVELKVVRGPFRAQINLQRQRLTLFLGDLYAGRFEITLGNDPQPQPGVFAVREKQEWAEFHTATGQTIPAGHPANPYGQWWIDVGSEISIHGSADQHDPQAPTGCISLSPLDASDVYGILSKGSQVEILR